MRWADFVDVLDEARERWLGIALACLSAVVVCGGLMAGGWWLGRAVGGDAPRTVRVARTARVPVTVTRRGRTVRVSGQAVTFPRQVVTVNGAPVTLPASTLRATSRIVETRTLPTTSVLTSIATRTATTEVSVPVPTTITETVPTTVTLPATTITETETVTTTTP